MAGNSGKFYKNKPIDPFLEKVKINEVEPFELNLMYRLANLCASLGRFEFNELDPAMRMAVCELINRRSSIHTKASLATMRDQPANLTLPRTLIIAVWMLCTKTDLLPEWESTYLIRLTDKYR